MLRDLRRLLGAETTIENDVDAAAVAERDHGHGRDFSTFAFVSVGTGIGMGLVLDGKLHRGAHGAAGEIAFLPLADGDARLRATRAGEAHWSRLLRPLPSCGPPGGRGPCAAAPAASSPRPRPATSAAREIVAREAAIVARALAAIVAVVDPELIVLGGGIGRAPGFAEEVRAALARAVAGRPRGASERPR